MTMSDEEVMRLIYRIRKHKEAEAYKEMMEQIRYCLYFSAILLTILLCWFLLKIYQNWNRNNTRRHINNTENGFIPPVKTKEEFSGAISLFNVQKRKFWEVFGGDDNHANAAGSTSKIQKLCPLEDTVEGLHETSSSQSYVTSEESTEEEEEEEEEEESETLQSVPQSVSDLVAQPVTAEENNSDDEIQRRSRFGRLKRCLRKRLCCCFASRVND